MGKLGKKYQMLIGEPCRCYYKHPNNSYHLVTIGYYIGSGYCVTMNFTDVRDNLNKGIEPILFKYDRYIPTRLFNDDWLYDLKRKGYSRQKPINSPDYDIEDFNTEVIEDWYYGHLDEFWWWKEIQKCLKKIIETGDSFTNLN